MQPFTYIAFMKFNLTSEQVAKTAKITTERLRSYRDGHCSKNRKLIEGTHFIKISRIYLYHKSAIERIKNKVVRNKK